MFIRFEFRGEIYDMGEEKEGEKSSLGSEKKERRRKKSLFEWSKGEEVNLVKKLIEFHTKKMGDEEFYPFLRNGSLAEVSKIQIFNKIQQLKNEYLEKKLELRKMRIKHLKYENDDEIFELSNRLWGEVETTGSTSTSKALDVCSRSYFEGFFDGHGLHVQLFTPSFLHSTNKDIHHLFSLQNHHFLIKANLKAQLAQLKYHIIQHPYNNPTNL